MKRKIRVAAEKEEAAFYQERAPEEWLQALEPLGTDEHKPFLETGSLPHRDLRTELRRLGGRESAKELLRH